MQKTIGCTWRWRPVPTDHPNFSSGFRYSFRLNGLYSNMPGLAHWSNWDFLSDINGHCTHFLSDIWNYHVYLYSKNNKEIVNFLRITIGDKIGIRIPSFTRCILLVTSSVRTKIWLHRCKPIEGKFLVSNERSAHCNRSLWNCNDFGTEKYARFNRTLYK